jgi:hypothetical protein
MDAEFSLNRRRRERALDLRRALRLARTAHGAAYLEQVREMLALRVRHSGLEPAEYYLYGLCDHARYDRDARRSFLGSGGAAAWARRLAWAASGGAGKLGIERLLRTHGLPTTRTLARYGGAGPVDGVRHLEDAAALGRFLRESAECRPFGKPAAEAEGQGVVAVDGWEPATDRLTVSPASAVGVLRLLRLLEPFAADGYLFQAKLVPHPELAPVLVGALSTVRALVLCGGAGPVLHRAAWRIPAGRNVADGFWSPGNLLAAIDPDNGRIWRVVDDIHPRQRLVEAHPDSGLPLRDRTLPDWTMLRATVLAAAELFPACPALAFDVALTEDGPVLVGVRAGVGDPVLLQLAHDRGLIDPAIERLLGDRTHARAA